MAERMTEFEKRCRKVADECGIEIVDVIYDRTKRSAYSDDDYLHVRSGRGQRFCFYIGDDDREAFNNAVTDILEKLDMRKYIDDALLIYEDEDERCPHCGCDCMMSD